MSLCRWHMHIVFSTCSRTSCRGTPDPARPLISSLIAFIVTFLPSSQTAARLLRAERFVLFSYVHVHQIAPTRAQAMLICQWPLCPFHNVDVDAFTCLWSFLSITFMLHISDSVQIGEFGIIPGLSRATFNHSRNFSDGFPEHISSRLPVASHQLLCIVQQLYQPELLCCICC